MLRNDDVIDKAIIGGGVIGLIEAEMTTISIEEVRQSPELLAAGLGTWRPRCRVTIYAERIGGNASPNAGASRHPAPPCD